MATARTLQWQSRIRLKLRMGLTPHSVRTGSSVYCRVMENKLSSTRLPPLATETNGIRIALDQLEAEAQTHHGRGSDYEKEYPVVPSGDADRGGTAAF